MVVTLDQARALDALARHGTFAKAAAALRKQHTAVLYAVRTLEEQTGLTILDRTGYRTKITATGEAVLAQCRKMLDAERELEALCEVIRTGWEPRLGVVFDGIVPADAVLRVVGSLAKERVPTRLTVTAEFLGGVEETFVRGEADLMISVLPPQTVTLKGVAMPPLRALLVAHKDHPLVAKGAAVTDEDLNAQVLLVVRGSDPRLRLSTSALTVSTVVSLNDFHAKKTALLEGFGFGWMPEHLITRELRRGTLARVRWKAGSTHTYHPHVYHRADRAPGRAAQRVIDALKA
ncbi:MAG: LysR family transcriptional regulator [Polyangiales bacterium]